MRTTVEAVEGEISPQLVEILVRQVERIDRLTNELYELTSIESGQVELAPQAVVIDKVVNEVVRDFGPELERSGIKVRTEIEADAGCWCDRRWLYRVLSNLLDNAVKYNREGGSLLSGQGGTGLPRQAVQCKSEKSEQRGTCLS